MSVEDLDVSAGVQNWYDQQAGIESTQLQIGVYSSTVQKKSDSHPYFKTKTWVAGSLTYRTQKFEGIPMIYDLESDALIIKRLGNGWMADQPLELTSNQVQTFDLSGSTFIFIDHEVDPFTTGFFELLYDGNQIDLLVKRVKSFEIDDHAKLNYLESHRYYLKRGSEYFRIRRMSNVYSLFKEQRKEMKAFVKQKKIQILKPKTDFLFVQLTEFCDQKMKQ